MKLDYNKQAKTWDDDPKKIERAKIFSHEISNSININNSMIGLEYGCGTGLLSFFLQPFFKKLLLCDTSDGMLEVLTKKIQSQNISNMFPVKSDLLKENTIKEKVNIIYTLMTLHHIPDLNKILTEFYNIIEDDGYLYIADLDKEDGTFHAKFTDFKGHSGFNQENLEKLLLDVGFVNVTSKIC